jgi:hypothetical protein
MVEAGGVGILSPLIPRNLLILRKRSFVAVLKSGEQAARGVSCLQD